MARSTETRDEFVARLIEKSRQNRVRFYHPMYRGLIAGAEEPPENDGDNDDDDDDAKDDDADKSQADKDRAELAKLRRERAEREKKDRKAEADRKKAEEKTKAEQGQYRQLAEERAAENEELKAEIDSLKKQMAQGDQRRSLESLAEQFGFRKPTRVWAILQADLGDEFDTTVESEELMKAALKNLTKSDPELVDQQRRSGAPGGGTRQRGSKPDPAREHNELVAGLFGPSQ